MNARQAEGIQQELSLVSSRLSTKAGATANAPYLISPGVLHQSMRMEILTNGDSVITNVWKILLPTL